MSKCLFVHSLKVNVVIWTKLTFLSVLQQKENNVMMAIPYRRTRWMVRLQVNRCCESVMWLLRFALLPQGFKSWPINYTHTPCTTSCI